MTVRMFTGDCREVLATLPDASVQMCVTSPPYFGLRDYGTASWEGGDVACDHAPERKPRTDRPRNGLTGSTEYVAAQEPAYRTRCGKCGATRIDQQIGLEPTVDAYVAEMVAVFRDVRRVLRDDGVLFLNLGDSYCSSPAGNFGPNMPAPADGGRYRENKPKMDYALSGLKPKDLIGIPWRVAFALQADGWYLRSDIIWKKSNPMPESVRDRPTKAHEYIFLLTKSPRYFWDAEAVKEADAGTDHQRTVLHKPEPSGGLLTPHQGIRTENGRNGHGRNIRSVWTIATAPFAEAHFATFPPALAERCIKAGTSEKGACSACGAPWVRVVEQSRPDDYEGKGIRWGNDGNGMRMKDKFNTETTTTGWQPTCACDAPGLLADDLEIIETPTGERVGDDPSLITGRAGMNRPRGENEGSRPITRYEQRKYAEQLRLSPHRNEMEGLAGAAFAHYLCTDRSGARPIPQDLLDDWIERGWLERVALPPRRPLEPVPCVVLDPFGGAGTVSLVAERLGRDSIYIELSGSYSAMAEQRIRSDAPMFAAVELG